MNTKDPLPRRWNFKKLDEELFVETLEFLINAEVPPTIETEPEEYAKWIHDIMASACNAAAPIVSRISRKKQAYWWSDTVSGLRTETIKARRRWSHSKRSRRDQAIVCKNKEDYARAKKALRNGIKKAKNAAWAELISMLDRDPWGLPYQLVMGKLRKSSPTLSEILEDTNLDKLLSSLFPTNSFGSSVAGSWTVAVEPDFPEEHAVDTMEMVRLVKKRPSRNVAPGLNNFKNAVWKRVPGSMLRHLANLFSFCLKTGTFPESWKKAILVLIPKGVETLPDKIKARPIYLLNEIGKIFERVIANRLNRWMEEDVTRELSPNQYGFRRCRSTVDAVTKVREITQSAIDNGEYAITVGIDIANAFNSIPWSIILTAMKEKGFPMYLCKIINSYLSERSIIYRNSKGRVASREVCADVPQGSVLGPLLWNIGFDSVLRVNMEDGCRTICYANDTLIIATSSSLFDTIVKTNIQLARTMRHRN